MSKRIANSEYRNVNIAFVAELQPIDAYKACLGKVEEIEGRYAANPASVIDLVDKSILVVGTSNAVMYNYGLTLTIATGVYSFDFIGLVDSEGQAIA